MEVALSSTVVVGVEGLVQGLVVAGVADRLAEQLDASIALVHVVEHEWVSPYGKEVEREQRRVATEHATAMLDEVGPLRAPTDRIVAYGDPAEALAHLAAERDAAFTVVGSRGQGAVKAALRGSVSRALVAIADRPLVIVPTAAPLEDVGWEEQRAVIVCGIDGSEPGDGALAAAVALAQHSGHELVAAHATDLPSPRAAIPGIGATPVWTHHAALVERQREAVGRLLERAEHAAGRRGVTVMTRMESGDPAAALERVAADERAQLIVVGSRGLPRFDAALMGSTSMSLAHSASRAIMIVPPGSHRSLQLAISAS